MRTLEEIAKDPRLDDEGTYDYLAEDLPADTCRWERGYARCDSCGKYRHLFKRSTHYFYCWDGWDYMADYNCWVCELANSKLSPKRLIRRWKFQQKKRREYRKFCEVAIKGGTPPKKARAMASRIVYDK